VLWALGYLEQALKRNQEALTLAYDLSHPLSLAFAQSFAGIFHAFRRDVSLAQESAEACICLSTRHGFPYWLASGVFLHGWTLAEQGQTKEGMAQIRQGIADYQATGAEMGRSHQLASLAEACGKTGQIEEGLAALADALATVKRTGERFFEAEIHRLKGELLLKAESAGMRDESGDSAAEACFLKAIEVARRQGARLWELRAMISLCRLWRSRGAGGKRKEARQQLGEIYGWFTEGFDTPDLKEARALLGG
jgi:predicted ATPase